MVADLIGGQVEIGVVAVPAAQGHLKSGALRAIGVMGKQRVASLPDLPTIAEQGFPDVDIAGWFAVIGPPKLPAAQVKRLHDAIVAAFATPTSRPRWPSRRTSSRRRHPRPQRRFCQRTGALCQARQKGEHLARLTSPPEIHGPLPFRDKRPRSRLRPTSRPKPR